LGEVRPLLEVRGITKRFGSFEALASVSFSIRPGEILGLIGPNGSGKTTLFECIAGVLPCDEGAIFCADKPLTRVERTQQLFYLPDAIAPWPAQTVQWALHYSLGLFGGTRDALQIVIDRFDLAPLLKVPIGHLSKGQRKRALLAFGLLTPQPLLIADEPFDGLDLRQTREVASALRTHTAERNRTMLLSIHQISDAARVCDRFVLLSNGKVAGQGTPAELTQIASTRGRVIERWSLEEVFLALT
jgi:ABC-2 type transport system ATP-binding protein